MYSLVAHSSLRGKKSLASILLVSLLSTLILPGWVAAATGFSYYSDILRASNIIARDFSTSTSITRAHALSIAVGIGGWPSGCSASSSVSCDIEAIARSRGLIASGLGNVNLGIIIRANALRLVLQARGIPPSSNPSGFTDVDGKINSTYTSYIAKAREIGCIQSGSLFRPFDATTEGEFAKMAVCSVESDEGGLVFSAAPSQTSPSNNSTTNPPTPIYYGGGGGGGGGGSTTILNNYYTNSFSGVIPGFTSTGSVNFLGSVNFANLPSLPLSYGSFYIGNASNQASEFATGSAGQVLTMVGGLPTWATPSLFATGGYGLVGSVFGRTGAVIAQIGDYTTTQVLEGTNLYFTDTRARSALSTISPLAYNPATGVFSIAPGTAGQILSTSGGIATWVNPALVGVPVTSIFGRVGAISSQTGDYISDQVTEGLSNLYFTNSRAQNALSGTVSGINNSLTNLQNQINTLSGIVASSTGGYYSGTNFQPQIDTLSGQVANLSNQVTIFTFTLGPIITTVNSFSGTVSQNTANIATLSGNLSTLTNSFNSLSGTVTNLSNTINTLSGGLVTTNVNVAQNTADIATLSGTVTNNFNTLSGAIAGTNANLSTLSGTVASLATTMSALSGQIAALAAISHDTVTLGTANGLSLSGQVLSLALASVVQNGALSSTDWTTFNSKQNALTFGNITSGTPELTILNGTAATVGPNVSLSIGNAGVATNGLLSSADWNTFSSKINLTSLSTVGSYLSYDNTTGVFGFTGTTTNFLEGSNLYFTDTRAQNALSGTIAGINVSIGTLSGQVATNTASISSLSGSLATLTNTVNILSGSLATLTSTVSFLSGVVSQNSADITSLSGGLALTNVNLSSLSGVVSTLSGVVSTLSNNLSTLTTTVSTLSGDLLITNTNLGALTATVNSISGSLSSLSGTVSTIMSTVNTLSGTVTNNFNTLSGVIASTNANLSTLSGAVSNLSTAITTLSGTVTTITNNVATLSGQVAMNAANIATLSGALATLSGGLALTNVSLASLSGAVAQNSAEITTLSGALAALAGISHPAVTLGTANGLSLSGQQISLTLASTATVGALSASDWNTFNSKINLTSLSATGGITYDNTTGVFGDVFTFNNGLTRSGNTVGMTTGANGQILTMSGTSVLWVNPTTVSVPVNSVFGRTGAVLGATGDYISDQVIEGSGNLYFTDTRAQNALSGTVAGINANIATATGNIATLSGQVAGINSTLSTLSGNLASLTTTVNTLSGNLASLINTVTTLSGQIATNTTNISTLSGQTATNTANISALSGSLANTNATLSSLSGTVSSLNSTINTVSGALATLTNTVNSLSGQTATNTANISALSGSLTGLVTTVNTLSGTVTNVINNLAILSGSLATTNANLSALSGTVTSNFNTLSGALASTNANLSSFSGSVATLASQIAALSGQAHDAVTLGLANGLSLSGQVLSLALASSIQNGALSLTDWNTFNNKIGLTSLSAFGPIFYDNTTGVFSWSGTTSDVLEGSNLYFTDTRAQNALSGTIAGINANIATLSGNLSTLTTTINTLSGNLATTNANVTQNTVNISSLSGTLSTLNSTLNTVSGALATLTTTVNTLSGQTALNTSNIATLSGSLAGLTTTVNTISGSLSTLTTTVNTLSGALAMTNSNLTSLSGTVATISTNISTLSGQVAALQAVSHAAVTLGLANGLSLSGQQISLTLASSTTTGALSLTDWNTFNSKENLLTFGTGLVRIGNNVGLTTGSAGQVLSMSGGTPTWITLAGGGISSLGGISSSVQFFSVGNTGTDFNIASSGSTHTFNIPYASSTATGLLRSIDWTTFNNKVGVISGTPNGLSISGSGISLALASSTTTGALSVSDYNAFSGKISLSSLLTGFVAGSGTVTSTDSVLSAFQKLQGSNTSQDVSINNLTIGLATATGNISTLQTNLATATGNIATLTTNLATTNSNVATITGQLVTINSNIATATGNIASLQTNLATATGNIATLSGNVNTLSGNLSTLSGVVATKISLTSLSALGPLTYNSGSGVFGINIANATTTGALAVADYILFNNKIGFISTPANGLSLVGTGLSLGLASSTTTGALSLTDWNTFNAKIGLTSLTATGGITYNNTTGLFGDLFTFNNGLTRVGNTVGLTLGSTGQILAMSGGAPTWVTSAGGGISSLNGLSPSTQTFAIGTAGTGFTINSSGSVHTFNIPYASLTASGLLSSTDWATFNNKVSFLSGATNGLSISGSGISLALASSTVSGALSATDWNTFNTKISFLSGAANGLSIAGSGISLALASSTTTGALSATDWNSFNAKIGSLNGLTGSTQTFAIGVNGTDFNIVSSGSVHTFNLPDASATARGLVNTGTQTFTGTKTFSAPLTIDSQQAGTGGLRFTQLTSASTGSVGNGKMLTVDGSGNVILTTANTVAGADVMAQKSTALILAVAPAIVPFNSIITNINSAYNGTTGIYTAPAGDTYEISASMTFNFPPNPGTTTSSACVGILRGGVLIVESCDGNSNDVSATAFSGTVNVTAPFSMTLGQTGAVIAYVKNVTAAAAPTFVAIASSNYLSIKRVGTAGLVTSDERLKKDIISFTGGLKDILGINTVSYQYNGLTKNAINDGRPHIGIIAQQVQSGSLGKWAISMGPDGFLRYDPNAIIYSLVNSVKELDKKSAITDTDEEEYQTTLGNSGSLAFSSNALDRFSFMVKKSLGKIDPNYGSSTSASTSGVLDAVSLSVNTLANSMSELSSQIAFLSGALGVSDAQIRALQASQIAIGTSSGNTDTIVPIIPTVISPEDQTALDMILGTAESLIIQGKTIFLEVVTFTQTVIFEKAVIFRSLVTFEDRVIFSDRDMGGSSTIAVGNRKVHVPFDRPYTETPVITITSVDHSVPAYVTSVSHAGFDIEVSSPASGNLRFNWMAVLVQGGLDGYTPPPTTPVEDIPGTPPIVPIEDTLPDADDGIDTNSGTIVGDAPVDTPASELPLDPLPETPAEIQGESVIPEPSTDPILETTTDTPPPVSDSVPVVTPVEESL